MTADNITVEQIDDLRSLLSTAVDSMANLWHDLHEGDVAPEEAAAIVNDMMTNLNAATR